MDAAHRPRLPEVSNRARTRPDDRPAAGRPGAPPRPAASRRDVTASAPTAGTVEAMTTTPAAPADPADTLDTPDTHVVLTGNPVDGLVLYGPFEDGSDASGWAAANLPGADWWVAPVRDAD